MRGQCTSCIRPPRPSDRKIGRTEFLERSLRAGAGGIIVGGLSREQGHSFRRFPRVGVEKRESSLLIFFTVNEVKNIGRIRNICRFYQKPCTICTFFRCDVYDWKMSFLLIDCGDKCRLGLQSTRRSLASTSKDLGWD